MKSEVDELVTLLKRFADNNVKPAPKILNRTIIMLERMQYRIQHLTKELAAKPHKRQESFREICENRLLTSVWAQFPPIPGSKYHRTWCTRCREPMRATQEMCAEIMAGRFELYCEKCEPSVLLPKAWHLTPRQRQKLDKTSS